jgi:hypothetical protein
VLLFITILCFTSKAAGWMNEDSCPEHMLKVCVVYVLVTCCMGCAVLTTAELGGLAVVTRGALECPVLHGE